jgi:XTP/dITP diphosphohydrolase
MGFKVSPYTQKTRKTTMKIILATGNKGKIKEIKHFFEDLNINFLSLEDYPHIPPVIEDGATLEENAIKKAYEIAKATGIPALSDDSGLQVDALNGAPGVYSARFAGENASYDDNNKKLIELLKNIPYEKRTAHFITVLAVVYPDGKKYLCEGRVDGIILDHTQGTNGFGYDPVFFIPELNKTFAELSLEEKNKISHRANALKKMKDKLTCLINN